MANIDRMQILVTVKGTRKVRKATKAINEFAKAAEKATKAMEDLKCGIDIALKENENAKTRD